MLIASVLVGASFYFIPPPANVNPNGWYTLGLLIPIVVVWGTEVLPVGMASVLFLALVVAFHLVGPDVAFKGFTNQLPWLIAGAFIIGTAMQKTGLSKRISYLLLSHVRGVWGLVAGAYVANIGLMGVPATAGRAAILGPVLRSVLHSIGDPKDSNLSRLLTFNFNNATNTFTSNLVLTGGVANSLMLAFYTSLTGHTLTWVQWLVVMAVPAVIFSGFGALGSAIFACPEPELAGKVT